MSVSLHRINKDDLQTLHSLLVRLTHNSHPSLWKVDHFDGCGSYVTSHGTKLSEILQEILYSRGITGIYHGRRL